MLFNIEYEYLFEYWYCHLIKFIFKECEGKMIGQCLNGFDISIPKTKEF